jgi:hypothetical protein
VDKVEARTGRQTPGSWLSSPLSEGVLKLISDIDPVKGIRVDCLLEDSDFSTYFDRGRVSSYYSPIVCGFFSEYKLKLPSCAFEISWLSRSSPAAPGTGVLHSIHFV